MSRSDELNPNEKLILKVYSHDIEMLLYLVAIEEEYQHILNSLNNIVTTLCRNFEERNEIWNIKFPNELIERHCLFSELLSFLGYQYDNKYDAPIFCPDGSLWELNVPPFTEFSSYFNSYKNLAKISEYDEYQDFFGEQAKLYTKEIFQIDNDLHYPLQAVSYFVFQDRRVLIDRMKNSHDQAVSKIRDINANIDSDSHWNYGGIYFLRNSKLTNLDWDEVKITSKLVSNFGLARNWKSKNVLNFTRHNQITAYLEGLTEYYMDYNEKKERKGSLSIESYKRINKNKNRIRKRIKLIRKNISDNKYLRQQYSLCFLKENLVNVCPIIEFFPYLANPKR